MAAERVIKVKLVVDAPASNTTAANNTANALGNVADKADKGGTSLISFGTILKTALVAGAGIATKAMLDLGMAYEQSLNQLQAVSGATAAQMTSVSDAAKQLGNDISLPGASAGDAAAAMTELAKGGLTVEEAMNAAKGTLQLAAAAQIEGAEAATIQSAALNTFGLSADKAGHVADVLANAANASSGEITDFAQGLAQSGLAAKAMGISLEDTATTLALFANNGLSGSDAGTSLKTMLISLTNPSDKAAGALEELGVKAFDAQGNFVGMRTVTEQLEAAQKTLTTEQFNQAAATAFGTDALRAAVAVAESGAEGFDSMSEAIGKQGGAAEVAAANSKGLAGAVDLVKNAAETAALGLYEQLSPALDTATRGIAGMVPEVADALLPALTEASTALIGLVDIIAPLIPIIGDALANAIAAAASALEALGPVIEITVEALGGALGVIAELPGPIIAAATAFALLATAAPFAAIVTYIGGIVTAARAAAGAMATLKAAMAAAFTGPGMPVILAAAAVATVIGVLVAANSDAEVAIAGATGAIDEQTGALTENAAATLAKAKADDGSSAAMEAVGVSASTYIQALQDQANGLGDQSAAIREVNAAIAGASYETYAADIGYVTEQTDAGKAAAEAWAGATAGLAAEQDKARLAIAGAAQAWTTDKADAYGASLKAIDEARKKIDNAPLTDPVPAAVLPSLESMSAALDTVKDSASAADTRLAFLQLQLDTLAGRAPDVEAAAAAAQSAIRNSVEAYLGQGDAVRGVAEAQDALSAAQNKAVGDGYTLEQKTRDVAAAQDALVIAQNNVADSSDAATEANRGVFEAFTQQTQAAYDASVANGDLVGAQAAARAKADELRTAFVNQQVAAGMSTEAANALADSIGLLPTETALQISLNGATAAQLAAEAVKRAIEAIPTSRTVTITTRNTTGTVVATEADGGIRQGGVQTFAEGGITQAAGGLLRQAMIAPGGSNILWAEDETQGESYVPHALSKRKRSQQIMAKTAAIFGDTYVVNGAKFMADGGFTAGSGSPAPVVVNRTFPLTVHMQNGQMTVDDLIHLQRQAERRAGR